MMQDVWNVAVEAPDDEQEQIDSLQRMISEGAWSLEGSVGRAMHDAIEAGVCVLGPNPASDYWGNRIPSRHEVVPGTKGSIDYANEQRRTMGWDELTEEGLQAIEAAR